MPIADHQGLDDHDYLEKDCNQVWKDDDHSGNDRQYQGNVSYQGEDACNLSVPGDYSLEKTFLG